jgi:vacuolar-type H+-ATPase subunit E/Vma4
MKGWGSVASVLDALTGDADAEAAAIREQAAAEAARLQTQDAATPVVIPDREVRLAAARREAVEALAREDWEDRRAALEDREEWIRQAAAGGLARVRGRGGLDPALLARLIAEARAHLPGGRLRVRLPPANGQAPGDAPWRETVEAAGAVVESDVADEELPRSGCVVVSEDGRALFDNSFEARARRLEAGWRTRLVGLYPP